MENFYSLSNDQDLNKLNTHLQIAFQRISEILRYHVNDTKTSTKNIFGDVQLDSDLATDAILFEELEKSGVVSIALSEENPIPKFLGGTKFIVTFDPLDGSSIIGSNWTVGTIYGVWPSDERKLIGCKCSEMITSGAVMYGKLCSRVGFKRFTINSQQENGIWILAKDNLKISDAAKTFAPGNLRAVNECPQYKIIVDSWISRCFTLRYTGGLVPDICQIFIKGEGILSNISTPSHPPKLRLLYEVGPLAFLVEKAGGKSTNSKVSIMDVEVTSYDQRSDFCGGSANEIDNIEKAYK